MTIGNDLQLEQEITALRKNPERNNLERNNPERKNPECKNPYTKKSRMGKI